MFNQNYQTVLFYLSFLLNCNLCVPPHTIYILVDDLGFANVEFHNNRIKTPFLNSLLEESIYIDNFYVYMCM